MPDGAALIRPVLCVCRPDKAVRRHPAHPDLARDCVLNFIFCFPDTVFNVHVFRGVDHNRQLAVVTEHAVITQIRSNEFLLFLPSGQAIMVETGDVTLSKT
jgi:hypothetical protein